MSFCIDNLVGLVDDDIDLNKYRNNIKEYDGYFTINIKGEIFKIDKETGVIL